MGKYSEKLRTLVSRTWRSISSLFRAKQSEKHIPAQAEWGRVAIVISHEKNMWGVAVVQRFVASLREQMGYQRTPDIEILAAQNSSKYLASLMGQIRERHEAKGCYEVIVTVGDWCSKEVRDILDTWQSPVPQVFCPVYDPVRLGLVDSLQHTGHEITGVTTVLPNFDDQFSMLESLQLNLKKVLVVYDSFDSDAPMSEGISAYAQQFHSAALKYGIEVCQFRIHSDSPSQKELIEAISQVDLVCTLPEPTVYSCLDILVAACNKAQVPLCTTELSSVYHGAAFGFGERGSTYGPYAASIVYDMLVNRRPLYTIPVITLNHQPYMRFNNNALEAQGVRLSSGVKHLLSMASIFRDTV